VEGNELLGVGNEARMFNFVLISAFNQTIIVRYYNNMGESVFFLDKY
jgi:hypothetical protein